MLGRRSAAAAADEPGAGGSGLPAVPAGRVGGAGAHDAAAGHEDHRHRRRHPVRCYCIILATDVWTSVLAGSVAAQLLLARGFATCSMDSEHLVMLKDGRHALTAP